MMRAGVEKQGFRCALAAIDHFSTALRGGELGATAVAGS